MPQVLSERISSRIHQHLISFVQSKIGFHCRPFRISLRVVRRGEGTMLGRGMMEDGEGLWSLVLGQEVTEPRGSVWIKTNKQRSNQRLTATSRADNETGTDLVRAAPPSRDKHHADRTKSISSIHSFMKRCCCRRLSSRYLRSL